MITVTKRYGFEACHHLPHYVGACHNLHGHSYKLDVTVGGSVIKDQNNPKCGMIIDFKELKKVIERTCGNLDHSTLNNYFANPTAEVMVLCLADKIGSTLRDNYNVELVNLKLWETEDSYAEWRNEQ